MTVNNGIDPKGTLYIIATPIGNLADMSKRAVQILQSVDCIFAEDTRHSANLLHHFAINTKMSSLHLHNENSKSNELIEFLLSGKSAALISDAGTPLICDPGFPLVKRARAAEINVIPIPGPCALITALSAAGIACDSFLFHGFLPAKAQARQNTLSNLRHLNHTLVFYESTHRIIECIKDIAELFGVDTQLVLAKELTKSYETFVSGNPDFILDWFNAEAGRTKGEFVIMVAPQPTAEIGEQEKVLRLLLAELPLKQAVSIAAKLTDSNKNELYAQALAIKKNE